MTGTYVSVPWNRAFVSVHGAKPMVTDGGLRYGLPERSAWVGGYDGPKAVPDPIRVREAFTTTLAGPIAYTLNLEGPHHTLVTSEVGAARARQHAQNHVDLVGIIRAANPQARIGHYPCAIARDYWTAVQYDALLRSRPTDFARLVAWAQTLWLQSPWQRYSRWQRSNDNVAFLIAELDYVSFSLYRLYQDQPEAYIRLHVAEARRLAGDKPVLPYFMPVYHNLNREVGGQPIPLDLWERDIHLAWNHGVDGVVIWASDIKLVRPEYVEIAQRYFPS